MQKSSYRPLSTVPAPPVGSTAKTADTVMKVHLVVGVVVVVAAVAVTVAIFVTKDTDPSGAAAAHGSKVGSLEGDGLDGSSLDIAAPSALLSFAPSASPSYLRTTQSPSYPPSEISPAPSTYNERRSSIVFALLPDTQYYSEGAPYIYSAQWLSENSMKIGDPFVMHLGDLVQSARVSAQWDAASESMHLLEKAGLSYSASPGNHDLRSTGWDDQRGNDEEFLLFFPQSRAASQPTFLGRDPLGYSEYHLVQQDGMIFLIMALDWRASDSTLTWAQQVLGRYKSVPVVLTSHEFLAPLEDGKAYRTTYGRALWNSLIRGNDNIFMVISGHIPGSGHLIDKNDFGHEVFSLLVDFQSLHAGGNGYMRLLELDLFNGTLEHLTFSPFVMDLYNKQGDIHALGPNDIVELTDISNKYSVMFDFMSRFQAINATIPEELVSGQGSSLLDPVRSQIESIPLPLENQRRKPTGPDDYPVINEVLAHWRFDSNVTGTPLSRRDVVYDLSGAGNDLIREDVGQSQPDFLTWNAEHHQLSSSAGSVCFSNPTRDAGGFLTTGTGRGSALSTESFQNGFTIEAFAKLANKNNQAHRWSGVISCAGEGQDANKTEGDLNEPLAVLGFSPSSELQFASFPYNQPAIAAAWSSPLNAETWYHFAAVNDGQSTRLYIDGYPARRDPVHIDRIRGIATANLGWSIGSSTYNRRRKVFGGCIGEVRIVGRALRTDEFLIARSDGL